MNRLGLALLLLVLSAPVFAGMAIAPGTPVHTHSDANTGGGSLALSGTLSSTKACISGFTRKLPNYCTNDSASSDVWFDATACTARTFPGGVTLPTEAKLVHLKLRWAALSANVAGTTITNNVNFWQNSSCVGGQVQVYQFQTREYVATAAGTIVEVGEFDVIVTPDTTTTFRATQGNAGGNGNVDFQNVQLLGYFD